MNRRTFLIGTPVFCITLAGCQYSTLLETETTPTTEQEQPKPMAPITNYSFVLVNPSERFTPGDEGSRKKFRDAARIEYRGGNAANRYWLSPERQPVLQKDRFGATVVRSKHGYAQRGNRGSMDRADRPMHDGGRGRSVQTHRLVRREATRGGFDRTHD